MTTNSPNRTTASRAQESLSGTLGTFGESSRSMLSMLSRTIEGDIIPRLMLAFDSPIKDLAPSAPEDIRLEDRVDEFVKLVLTQDARIATDYVSALRSQGVPLTDLYLGLLAPAAQQLGVMWEEDACSFTDVTIGVCRMHEVMLDFSRCFDDLRQDLDSTRSALIVSCIGEQHTFGLFMVAEFLRRAGWSCWTGTPTTIRDFRRILNGRRFDVVGVSLSADRHIDQVSEQIAEVRRTAADAGVIVGGRPFTESPQLAERIGADATAPDGETAVEHFNALCRKMKRKTLS